MTKVYYFLIRNDTILYSEDTYIGNFLRFNQAYNHPKMRFKLLSMIDKVNKKTYFEEIYTIELKEEIGKISPYITNCIYQIINEKDILLSVSWLYDYILEPNKSNNIFIYTKYNKKYLDKTKFDNKKIYIN